MKIFRKIFKTTTDNILSNEWHKGILVRTAFHSWILIILTLLIFIVGTLPYQLKIIEDRMKSEANDIAGSIGLVTATAIINNDFGTTVDHCMKIVKQSSSILYITIIRNDGFSLIHTANGWKQETVNDDLNILQDNEITNEFVFSKLVKQEVFHYSFPFSYSGIDWGRINVGLSLKNYNQNIDDIYFRTFWLAISSILLSLLASVYFAKKLTQPIRRLDNVARKVAEGNLDARVKIDSKDEIGRLSHSFNKMTESLKGSQDNLEKKVELRTAELKKINKILHNEIKERLSVENTLKQYNSRLEAFDKIYRGIISAKSVDEIIMETLTQLPTLFTFIDQAAVTVFDYITDTIDVRTADFNSNINPSLSTVKIPINYTVLNDKENPLNGAYFVNDIRLIKKMLPLDDELFSGGFLSYLTIPLIIDNNRIGNLSIASKTTDHFNEAQKEILLVVTNQLAVAINQAQLQAKINGHAKSLQNSLSEKEVLLKEIHHRVKNNLQVISSLLYLNSKKIQDKEVLNMFKESQNRVKSIALIHERLYQSKDLGSIDFKEYVQRLTNDLFRSYAVNQSVVRLDININNVFVNIDTAVPCGLIINELISNSFKYAFPNYEAENKTGIIRIDFTRLNENELSLVVSDDGIGIPQSINEKKNGSLGLQLVETLVAQLEGILEIDGSSGTTFKIKFAV